MLRTPTIGSLVVATALLGAAPGTPAPAGARGHHGGVYVGVGYGGFYGWGPYWGWGAPYWGWGWGPGPYGYGYGAQPALLGYAMMSGMGGLDVDAKPNRAEVWVDGKYVSDARDLDGNPAYLWLKQGTHHVVLYKAGYKSFDEEMDVRAGMLRQLKVQLEKGESQPPVRAAAEPRPETRPAEPRVEAPMPQAEAPMPQGEPHGEVGLRVEPRDATVYIDGKFLGIARELGVLQLPAGHHRVDLARPGYRELTKEFDVEAGRKSELALSMERGGGWKF
jgi:hypothetical protein